MEFPIVRTPQQIAEQKIKEAKELADQHKEQQIRRAQHVAKQREVILLQIQDALKTEKKHIVYDNTLYPEIRNQLEAKGYQCISPSMDRQRTHIFFDYRASRERAIAFLYD